MARLTYEAPSTLRKRRVQIDPMNRVVFNIKADITPYELNNGRTGRVVKRTKARRGYQEALERTFQVEPAGNIDELVENRVLIMQTILAGHLPPWTTLFMNAYANSKNVRLSCLAANIDRETFDLFHKHSENFKEKFLRAKEDAIDLLDAKGWQAAMSGKDPNMLRFYLSKQRPVEFGDRVEEAYAPGKDTDDGKYDEVVLEWANGTPVIDATSRVIEQENHALGAPPTEPQVP